MVFKKWFIPGPDKKRPRLYLNASALWKLDTAISA